MSEAGGTMGDEVEPGEGLDRRRFLGLGLAAGVGAAAIAAGCSPSSTGSSGAAGTTAAGGAGGSGVAGGATTGTTALGVPSKLFPDGVIAGDPQPAGTVLWTRVAPELGARPLRWEAATDAAFTDVVAKGTVTPDAATDLTARVAVEGLASDRWYHYRFVTEDGGEHGGEVSPIGRFRTSPAPGAPVDEVVFAWSSCQQINDSFYVAHKAAAAEPDLDFFVHLGDYVYVDDNKTLTLDDYRAQYRRFKANPMLQELQATVPLVAMFDDGEFYNGIDRTGPPDRLAAAHRAWFETMPQLDPTDSERPAYRRLQWGDLFDLFMVDSRSYRDPAVDNVDTETPEGAVMLAEGRTTLGAEQKAWLLDGLTSSTAAWRILGNPYNMSMVRTADRDPGPPRAVNAQVNDGVYFPNEAWDDYNAERREVLQHIVDAGVKDVVSFSGHTHVWIAGVLQADMDDPASPVAAFDFTCGSLTADPDLLASDTETPDELRPKRRALETAGLAINPLLRYLNVIDQGYGLVRATKDQLTIEFKLVDPFDEHAEPKVGARFVLPRGATDVSAERFPDAER